MSIQRLSAKNIGRLAQITGLDVVYGYANGGYAHFFVTSDHRHGWYDLRARDWGFEDDPVHIHPICGDIEAANTPNQANNAVCGSVSLETGGNG